MKRQLALPGKALMGIGATGLVGYLIALTQKAELWPWLFGLFGSLMLVGLVLYVAGQRAATIEPVSASQAMEIVEASTTDGPFRGDTHNIVGGVVGATESDKVRRTSPPFTAAWRHTSDGFEASPLMTMASLRMPGSFGQADEPFVRIGAAVACDRIPPNADSSEAAKHFIDFLSAETVATLMRRTVGPGGYGYGWTRQAGRGIDSLQAVYGWTPEKPVGSAMLNVPVSGRNLFGRDDRMASLWLHCKPGGLRGSLRLGPRPFQDHDVSPRMVNGRSMERPAHRVASVMSSRPARRSAPIARLRRAAMILGPDRVLTWDLSS